jgi:hypothetical protein
MNGNVCVDPRCPLGSPNRRLCSDADFAQKLCSWLVPMKIARIKRVPAGSPRRARLTEDHASQLRQPLFFPAEAVSDQSLSDAFGYCLRDEARSSAKDCCAQARVRLSDVRHRFFQAVATADRVK